MTAASDVRLDPQVKVITEFIALTPGDTEIHRLFNDLIDATNDELAKLGLHRTLFVPSPDSAGFAKAHICAHRIKVSDELLQGWERFAESYPALVSRNPRLELRDLMQEISERREAASWPHMAEWEIERWIADGAPVGRRLYPIDDDVRDRLLELHPILGGWLYLDENLVVTFAETEAFRQVKVRLDAEREVRIQADKARHAEAMERTELAMCGSTPVQFGGITMFFKDKDTAAELQHRLDELIESGSKPSDPV